MQRIVKITRWYGRFGNNIQQLLVAKTHSLSKGWKFSMPNHDYISNFSDKMSWIERLLYSQIRNRYFFYSGEWGFTIEKGLTENFFNLVGKNYIYPNFKFSVDEPLDDDTLIIHLRGGDVFEKNCPHKEYVQNPLDFYRKIIPSFKKTIVVAEAINSNPVLPHLLAMPHVSVSKESLIEDFSILLRARNLVSSGVGTFCLAAAICSPNLKNFFCSDRYLKTHLNPEMLQKHLNVHMINLPNYIDIGDWTYNDEIQKYMFEYKL